MIKEIASRILGVTGPGRLVIAGASSPDLLTELLLSGCDAWAVCDQAFSHPRCVRSADQKAFEADTLVCEIGVRPGVPEVLTSRPPRNLVLFGGRLPRRAIDESLLSAGWRRHPGGLRAEAYSGLSDEILTGLTFYQHLPEDAFRRWPTQPFLAQRNSHLDMLRETGSRADAHIARYALAAQWVRPGDRVLDCSCGPGYGTAVLASLSRGGSFLGVDPDPAFVDYATANYGRQGVSFQAGNAADLAGIADNSIDIVVSFEIAEPVEDWERILAGFRRVLRADGRIIASLRDRRAGEKGSDHPHAFDWPKFAKGLQQHFILERRYALSAPGGFKRQQSSRSLERVPLDWNGDAEWFFAVASRNPLEASGGRDFVHPAFGAALARSNAPVVDFGRWYDNPYLYRSMVQMGERLDSPEELARLGETVVGSSRRGSADQGAAICILGYRALEERDVDRAQRCLARITEYRNDSESQAGNPHVLRWRLSLAFLAGRLAEMLGDLKSAMCWLNLAASDDWKGFSPLLATKTVSACFHLGVLNLVQGDRDAARDRFLKGVQQSLQAAHADPRDIVGDPEVPVPFGLHELAELLDMGSQCVNALANLTGWERDRGAFWRNVDIRRFGLATWARELERDNAELVKRIEKARIQAAQTTERCSGLETEKTQLLREIASLTHELAAARNSCAAVPVDR